MGRAAAATDVASARRRSVTSWLSSVWCNRWIFTSSPLHHPPPPAPHPQLLHTCLSAAQPGAMGKAPRSHFQPLRGERHRRREMIESPSPLHFFFLHLFPLQWINLCLQCRIGVCGCTGYVVPVLCGICPHWSSVTCHLVSHAAASA